MTRPRAHANLRRREAEHMRQRLREAGERPRDAERHALAVAAATPPELLGAGSRAYRPGGGVGGRTPKRRSPIGRKVRHAKWAAHRRRGVAGRVQPLLNARSPTR